jgi:pyridoxamine 5'-phosphate oxidase-like protein
MIRSLPAELLEVVEQSVTTELVTIDDRGRPVASPVQLAFRHEQGCIDITAGFAKADDAARDPHVAVLFSDPAGAGPDAPPMVLVQGTAQVRDRVRVRPERVYVWPGADPEAEPRLYDAHLEEVRSAHNAEPETGHAEPEGGPSAWDASMEELGLTRVTAALAFVGPDGFPFAVRVPVQADADGAVVRIGADPVGAPIEPGPACLCADELQVLGDLVEDRGGWVLQPRGLARQGG